METQDTVARWCNENYPNDFLKDKVRGLIEEASELAVAAGALSLEEALNTVKQVWHDLDHLPKSAEHVASSIADVQIYLFTIADETNLSVQTCLDDKMSKNRKKV